MTTAEFEEVAWVRSVLHPTDLSEEGDQAFAHALAIALLRGADFTLFHVDADPEVARNWARFPRVRETLERWGLLPPGSPSSAVFDRLRVQVQKVSVHARNTAGAVAQYAWENDVDLIVVATEGRDGPPRWIRPSVAADAARQSRTMTLFVPKGVRGIVSLHDGKLGLERVLVPVDEAPGPLPAMVYTARLVDSLDGPAPVEVTLLHVGDDAERVPTDPPSSRRCEWRHESREGDVVEQIVAAAADGRADLIAMTTAGRHGFLDALRGSVTEQVLRRAPCPVLAIPGDRE